eukprot:2659263-Alexandrium_andersonii.AAC.1
MPESFLSMFAHRAHGLMPDAPLRDKALGSAASSPKWFAKRAKRRVGPESSGRTTPSWKLLGPRKKLCKRTRKTRDNPPTT